MNRIFTLLRRLCVAFAAWLVCLLGFAIITPHETSQFSIWWAIATLFVPFVAAWRFVRWTDSRQSRDENRTQNDFHELEASGISISDHVRFSNRKTIAFATWFVSFLGFGFLLPDGSAPDRSAPDAGVWAMLALLVPLLAAWGVVRWIDFEHKRVVQRARRDKVKLDHEIQIHRRALYRNYRMALRKNDYGAVQSDGRDEVLLEFVRSIDFEGEIITESVAVDYVSGVLENLQSQEHHQFNPDEIPSNGYDFEHWVAESLQKFGWDAKATTASGDQGIDVIASQFSCSVGIQCKLYSKPVGNNAVQQAIAGVSFHQLDVAAVLSNATFTKSAQDLASAARVLLLSPHDIPDLKMLSEQIQSA